MSKRDMFHNPQIRYVGWWQGDILCDWKHTHTHTLWQKQWRQSWDMTLNPVKMKLQAV